MRAHAVRFSRNWRGQHSSLLPSFRPLSTTPSQFANALPITATGPPPDPPTPTSGPHSDRVTERRRKAALLQAGKDIRASQSPSSSKKSPLKKRFWKDVHIRETPAGLEVHLDARPVRTPSKAILTIPKSKPHLAHAIAIEWDMLENAQQALKNHNIPMTSTTARAQDIVESEAKGDHTIRNEIIAVMMGYLDTDTLLCWAPEHSAFDTGLDMQTEDTKKETLRERQIRTARPIITFLNTSVWPGVEIKPVLDEGSIMPVKQSEFTRSVIQGWIAGLPAFELAALERAVLATKSLLVGTRLLIEWSEEFRDIQRSTDARFGIEEAAEAATLEVRWQTAMWGEVEDTHDVDNEDIRRQLGSAILLVTGRR
ncbi:ATP synthase mitochondrial F1 complex assembly factor 2 [Rhinocladiella similis]